MITPYNTGRVQIGILYTPAMPQIYGDALKLQTALLERHTHRSDNVWHAIVNKIYRWL